jgi:hypothetical protein
MSHEHLAITVNSELAHLWIRLLKSLHSVKEMDKNESLYTIPYFDPGKVWEKVWV